MIGLLQMMMSIIGLIPRSRSVQRTTLILVPICKSIVPLKGMSLATFLLMLLVTLLSMPLLTQVLMQHNTTNQLILRDKRIGAPIPTILTTIGQTNIMDKRMLLQTTPLMSLPMPPITTFRRMLLQTPPSMPLVTHLRMLQRMHQSKLWQRSTPMIWMD